MADVFVPKIDNRNRTRVPTACIVCGVVRMLRTDALSKYCRKCSAVFGGLAPKPSMRTGQYANCLRCGNSYWKHKCEPTKRFCSASCANLARKAPKEEKDKKIKARSLANIALSKGEIEKKPCEVCNTIPAEMHHDDYGKPLEIRWLCFKHHTALHVARGDLKSKVNNG